MERIVSIIVGVLVVGVGGLLCLFLCLASTISDKYWQELKKEKEDERE